MKLYLIRYYNDKYVVESETSLNAIQVWIDTKNKEEKEVYESKRAFKPNDFSIEKIGTHHGIIKAPD